MNIVELGQISSMKYGKMLSKDLAVDEGFPVYSGYRITGYSKEYLYNDPMLIVVARGVGGTGDVKISPPNAWITNLSIVLELDDSKVDKQYLCYLLNRENLKDKLNSGAAQAQITIDSLAKYRIRLPPIKQQKKTAEFIAKYDDLIENNRRRIQLLEESARLLYQEWFVHLRFPGHEQVRITDGVPDGWEKRHLIEIADILMGQSPKSEFYNDTGDGLPFHQGVTNYGFRFVEHKTFCTKVTRLAEAGDILCSVRAPVGRLNITNDKMVLGRGLSAIRSKSGYQSFLFYALKSFFFKEDILGGGAIYAAVTKKDMETLQLLVPNEGLLDEFESMAKEIDAQIFILTKQNNQLTQARDLLLPKLMSGELTV